jgi:hypothetical protein
MSQCSTLPRPFRIWLDGDGSCTRRFGTRVLFIERVLFFPWGSPLQSRRTPRLVNGVLGSAPRCIATLPPHMFIIIIFGTVFSEGTRKVSNSYAIPRRVSSSRTFLRRLYVDIILMHVAEIFLSHYVLHFAVKRRDTRSS